MNNGNRLHGAIGRVSRWIGLEREATVSLFIHGCFQFGASMSGLFLNLYLWRLTGDLWINGMFNIILYAMTPPAFALGGWIAKRLDRIVTYRIGIVMIAAFYLVVVVARNHVVEYYPLFAFFSGLSLGLYWIGYLVLMYDVSDARNRGRYLGVNMIVFNSAGLAGPALAGYLIGLFKGLQGYIVMFSIACFMFLVAAVSSTQIRPKTSHHRTYYLKFAAAVMKRNRAWLLSLCSFFMLGIFQGIMLFLPNILLYQTAGNERWVGLLTVFFSLLMITMGVLISRRKGEGKVRRDVLVSVLLISASGSLLLPGVRLWSVLVFMVVFSFFNPLTVNSLTAHYYRLMDFLPLKGQFRIEAVVIRELFLNVGRVLSIFSLILLADNPQSSSLPYVLVATSLLQAVMLLMLRRPEETKAKRRRGAAAVR